MKFNYFAKATPFLLTLFLITYLSISNQKQYTKLRILIWNTPTLTLGTYLSISAGTGFILAYFITTTIATINNTVPKKSLTYKENNISENTNVYTEANNNLSYDNTLIERDINDPSPTINASFRIIGRKERSNINFINNTNTDHYEDSIEVEERYEDESDSNEKSNQGELISTDWNDESYSSW